MKLNQGQIIPFESSEGTTQVYVVATTYTLTGSSEEQLTNAQQLQNPIQLTLPVLGVDETYSFATNPVDIAVVWDTYGQSRNIALLDSVYLHIWVQLLDG